MATTDTTNEALTNWHFQLLIELGFSKAQATALSDARVSTLVRDRNGQPKRYDQRVDHHMASRLLAAGATHDQVVAILA